MDLIPREVLAPRLRTFAVGAVVVGLVVGGLLAIVMPLWIAVVIGLLVALPVLLASVVGLRRAVWLNGREVHMRNWRTLRVSVPEAIEVEILVVNGKFDLLSLRLSDGRDAVTVPLAVYAGNSFRELPILALRRLADALVSGQVISAAAISSLLVGQLRAEARGAGPGERPLFQAAALARSAGRGRKVTLTDSEVAGLTD